MLYRQTQTVTIQHTLTKQNLGFYVKLTSVHIFKVPYVPNDILIEVVEVGFYEVLNSE